MSGHGTICSKVNVIHYLRKKMITDYSIIGTCPAYEGEPSISLWTPQNYNMLRSCALQEVDLIAKYLSSGDGKTEKHIRCESEPKKEHHPHPAFHHVVIIKQLGPGTMHSKPTKNKLEDNSKKQPDEPNRKRLPC